MAKKSKSKSDKSEDTEAHGTVVVATTAKTNVPIDPLLASLFEKSVSFHLKLPGNSQLRT